MADPKQHEECRIETRKRLDVFGMYYRRRWTPPAECVHCRGCIRGYEKDCDYQLLQLREVNRPVSIRSFLNKKQLRQRAGPSAGGAGSDEGTAGGVFMCFDSGCDRTRGHGYAYDAQDLVGDFELQRID